MQYVYAVLWFVIAAMLIFRFSKESKFFYIAGGAFIFLGIWWLLDAIYPEYNMFEGIPGIIFRVVLAIVLLLTGIYYYRMKKRENDE